MITFSTALCGAIASNYGLGMAMNKGVIRVYSSPRPAHADLAPTGTKLGEVSKDGIVYVPGSNKDTAGLTLTMTTPGVLSKTGSWRLRGVANGVALWFRWYSSQVDDLGSNTHYLRVDGDINADLFLADPNITISTNVEIELFTVVLDMQ